MFADQMSLISQGCDILKPCALQFFQFFGCFLDTVGFCFLIFHCDVLSFFVCDDDNDDLNVMRSLVIVHYDALRSRRCRPDGPPCQQLCDNVFDMGSPVVLVDGQDIASPGDDDRR